MKSSTSGQTSNSSRPNYRILNRLFGLMLIGSLLVLFSAGATAQTVLVWSTGNNGGSTTGVASWLQASGQFTSVTGIDSPSMTLAQLLAYDRVLYFSNTSGTQDPTAVGNTLADYADTGRRLVLSTFSWANQGTNTLGGRIITQQLSPLVLQSSSLYSNVTMNSHDASGFFNGVNSINGYFHDDVMLTPSATSRALWSDGEPLLATKGNIVAVNLFPDDSWGSVGGDYRRLFVNSLGVPEPASWVLAAIAFVGFCARGRKRSS